MQRLFRWSRGGSTTADADDNIIGSDYDSDYDDGSSSGADDIYDDDEDIDKPTIAKVIPTECDEGGATLSSEGEIVSGGDDTDGEDNHNLPLTSGEQTAAPIIINDLKIHENDIAGINDGTEIKPPALTFITSTVAEINEVEIGVNIDDSFPRAKDFLIDMNDDTITLANQATEIVDGFDENDGNNFDDDAKTIATHRTTATRVHAISFAYRLGMTNTEEMDDEHNNNNMVHHPHQSIYDILDKNFEQLGDSGTGGRQIGHKDVKLCFVAFVAVFHLPSDPPFIRDNLHAKMQGDAPLDQKVNGGNAKGKEQSSSGDTNSKEILQRVPLSVAFALWSEVLQQLGHAKSTHGQALSYIRSTLVLLGMLNLAKIERDRDDGVASTFGVSSSSHPSKSIDCLVVHDHIHQQYGEYLAWGSHTGAYRSLIEANRRRWNEAGRIESEQIGSNYFTLRMLPIHTMRAHHFQDTFDLLKDKTFVRRRIRVLGAMGAARAHVSDMDELLRLIENCITNCDPPPEPVDEREGLLDAYKQMLKYFLHETEELTKCNKDENGNTKLGKAAMLKIAQIGNAVHLLGASFGGYGFFDEEIRYYRKALELKTLAENGNIEKSVSASDTLHSMGFSLDNSGKRDEALKCYNQALDIRYACLGDDDLRVAETQHNKGALLCEEDKGDEAMECLEEALRIREIHYGEEHESCADTMQWMGNCLRNHGDPSDALDYFKFALSIKRKILGSDDIDVANTLFNTAVLLDDIEKYELSLVAYTEALRIRKLVLGKKNQEVADTLFCMGNVATVLENHQSALAYYNESIAIMEEAIHDDDPISKESDAKLLFLSNPISLRPDLEVRYKKMIQCLEEALPLTKLIMGTNHPKVCTLLQRMGDIYMKLHDWDNAIGSFQGALRVKRSDATRLGDDVQVAELLQKKGEAYLFKNEFVKAKATFDSAIQIQKRFSSMKDSLPLASFTCCLGMAYYYLNDFAHAKLLFQECIRIQLQVSGDDESCIVYSLCWLGRQHQSCNEPRKALELYLLALQRCKTIKSIDYRVVVQLLHAIGEVCENESINQHDMSLKCFSKEIDLINSKLEMEEEQTARMLADAHYKSGMLFKKRVETEMSIEHFKKALESTKKCHGDSADILEATITDNLGMLHASKSDFTLAKTYYSSAYSAYESTIGRDDLKTSDCAFRLGVVLEQLESNLAHDFYKESLRVRRLHIVDDDERVAETLFYMARLFLKRNDHQNSVACLEESLDIRKRLFDDCFVVAETYHALGKAYCEISQGEKALIFYRESVRINKNVRNEDALYKVSLDMAQCASSCVHYHLAIECYTECLQLTKSLDSTIDTALVMQKMGEIQMNKLHNYADAKKLLLDALEIRRGVDVEGCDGSEVTNLLLLIAQASVLAKDYDDALDFYEEHIEMLESDIPEHQYLLADSLLEMGNILVAMDENPDYELAIEKLNDCLDIKRNLFGSDSDEVANVVFSLATVYEHAGNQAKAIESLSEALRSFKLNKDKGGSVKVYHSLAKLKASNAIKSESAVDRTAAIECYREALRIRRQMSVSDIDLASILFGYANLLCLNDDTEVALPMLEEALQTQKSKSGLKNELVANILLRIAEVYVQQEKYDASIVFLEQVLLIHSSLLPEGSTNDCIDMGLCYYLLGKTYRAQGELHKAISSYLECIPLKQHKFGANSLECAVIHNELGEAYGKVEDFDMAIESIVQALQIRKKELGNNSIEYGDSVFNLAKIHVYMGKHDKAVNCLDEAMRVFKLSNGGMNKTLAQVYELKGDALYEVNENEMAASMFQECVDLLCSSEHDDARAARLNIKLGRAFVKLGDYTEAFKSYHEAIRIFSDTLGKDDLTMGDVMYEVGLLVDNQGGHGSSEKALACFNEVARIYDVNGKGRDAKVADALVQKSTLLADFDEASSVLNEAIEIYTESLGEDAAEIGKVMLRHGKLHEDQHNDDEAMAAFNEALRIFQISFGDDNINVSICLSHIGKIHARKLEYSEAVHKCKMALKIRVSLGEPEHDIADSVFNIGNILNDWGKADEALEYFQQGLKIFILLGGEDSISAAKCEAKLGAIYCARKDFDSSLPLFLHALRVFEEETEEDMHTVLASIHQGIGDCYYNKCEYDKALESFAKCIQMYKMEHGDDCIEMATPCDYIGLIYQKKGRYDESMNFHSKALHIHETCVGRGSKECASSHFYVAKCLLASHEYEECIIRIRNHLELFCGESCDDDELSNVYHTLGLAQNALGDHEESIGSLNRVLAIRTKLNGKSSLQVAETLLDMAKVLEESGDSEQAITVYDQALTLFHDLRYRDFSVVAEAYSRLGAIFEEKDNIEASLHAWKEALKISSIKLGNDSIAVAGILYHIGLLYVQLGNYDKSTKCLSESVKIFRSQTEGDSMVAVSLGFIGKNYMRKKQYAKAVEVSTESLRLKKQHARAEDVAESLVDLGNILKAWGKSDQAIQFFDEALRTYTEALGFDSVEVASCKHSIGLLKKSVGDTDAALRCFGESLQVYRRKEGDKSLNVADNLFQIGQIYESFGNKDKSMMCFEECLKVRKEILGDDHLEVLAAQRFVVKQLKYYK